MQERNNADFLSYNIYLTGWDESQVTTRWKTLLPYALRLMLASLLCFDKCSNSLYPWPPSGHRGFKCRQVLSTRSYMGSAANVLILSHLLWPCALGSSLSPWQQPQLTMQISLKTANTA